MNAKNGFRHLAAFLSIMFFFSCGLALVQETREDEWAARQGEKATRLRPYEPTPLERRVEQIGNLLNLTKRPVCPFIGSTFGGGGLALGLGLRARYGDTGIVDAHIAWSAKDHKLADGSVKLPTFASNRIGVELRANWLDAPNVAFYRTGNDSLETSRTILSYRTATVGIATRVQATKFFAVGGGLDAIRIESGQSATFSWAAAGPMYRRGHVFAEVDWRQSPGYTTRGGLYRVDWSDYRQTNAGAYSFSRVDAELRQFIPILHENWVIALRVLGSTTSVVCGQNVPYVLMPDLGGSHTLRGYPAWRFRDRHRLLLTVEYRWKAGQLVDMALFIDAGEVAPRLRDFDSRNFRKTYGLGMSVHTPISTVTRVEVARTREGTSLILSFSPSF
ncbi:MAG: hypothetical protein A2W03_12060 [Candidatus Aminicenantes bacterium RBG_16_63_16]|nr:MAG: hypothetical protein A2W03_12060 [Candidatus Aminicenantes bacterium RBG_16_63_16]